MQNQSYFENIDILPSLFSTDWTRAVQVRGSLCPLPCNHKGRIYHFCIENTRLVYRRILDTGMKPFRLLALPLVLWYKLKAFSMSQKWFFFYLMSQMYCNYSMIAPSGQWTSFLSPVSLVRFQNQGKYLYHENLCLLESGYLYVLCVYINEKSCPVPVLQDLFSFELDGPVWQCENSIYSIFLYIYIHAYIPNEGYLQKVSKSPLVSLKPR